ncbi:MAG: hypothetical protein AAF827_15680 [Cyanobacteria bacterium P01_D01_bin.6]
MSPNKQRIQEIRQITGLRPTHFADLIRVAQIIDSPGNGIPGRIIQVDWLDFEMPEAVVGNLRALGDKYRYESPHVDIDLVWDDLTPEARSWFMAYRSVLWRIEEAFPAFDED